MLGCYLMYFSQTTNLLEIKLGIDLKQAPYLKDKGNFQTVLSFG